MSLTIPGGTAIISWVAKKSGRTVATSRPQIAATAAKRRELTAADYTTIAAALAGEAADATDPEQRSRLYHRAGELAIKARNLEANRKPLHLSQAEIDAMVAQALGATGLSR